MKTSHPKSRPRVGKRAARRNQLFAHWQQFVVQLYGNGGMVPTLDWRGGIAIDHVRRECVAFCVTSLVLAPESGAADKVGNFYFTGPEARRVFDRYFRLREEFVRNKGAPRDAAHLRPETWTRKPPNWRLPFAPGDVDLAIASLIAYWDACATKPDEIEPTVLRRQLGDIPPRDEFWDLVPLPQLVRASDLPPRLRRKLQVRERAFPNPMNRADPPVKLQPRARPRGSQKSG